MSRGLSSGLKWREVHRKRNVAELLEINEGADAGLPCDSLPIYVSGILFIHPALIYQKSPSRKTPGLSLQEHLLSYLC